MGKALPISLKLNFTPNTLGGNGLIITLLFNRDQQFCGISLFC